VALVVRRAEVLDLGLSELAHAQQALLRADLVAERLAHLRHRERQLAAVVVQQVAEVHENALRRPQHR